MTKKENFISVLAKKFWMSEATAKVVFEATDKYLKDNNETKYNSFRNCYSENFQKTIEKAKVFMQESTDYSPDTNMDEEITA